MLVTRDCGDADLLKGLGVRRKKGNNMLLTTKNLKTHSETCTLMKIDLLVVLLVLSEVLRLRLAS